MTYADFKKQAWLFGTQKVPIDRVNDRDRRAVRVRQLLAKQLGRPYKDIYDDATLSGDLGMDYLDRVENVMNLEAAYNVPVTDQDAERWQKVKDIIDWRKGIVLNPAKMSTSVCSNCGKRLPVGSSTCPTCGSAKLNKAQEAIMADADKYKTSTDLLKALEGAETKKASYSDFKKQAVESYSQFEMNNAQRDASRAEAASYKAQTAMLSALGNIGVGAGLGALGGGLVSLLPTNTPKRDRLKRALMLMAQGSIIGGSVAGIANHATGLKFSDVRDGIADWIDQRRSEREYNRRSQTVERNIIA